MHSHSVKYFQKLGSLHARGLSLTTEDISGFLLKFGTEKMLLFTRANVNVSLPSRIP